MEAVTRRLAGIKLGDDRTIILHFRRLLECHGPTETVFAEANTYLSDKGIASTENEAKARLEDVVHHKGQ